MWTNTQLFRAEALHFDKYGYYTGDAFKSPAWYAYWEEQKKRCIEGYSVGNERISGEHYFYLNFCQIKLTDTKDSAVLKGVVKDKKRAATKRRFFPDFWDTDADYYLECEKARLSGQHMIVLKARRKGYSYKNGAAAAHRYNFERDAITVIAAFDKKYLYPEGTMGMANNYINFINEHTGWAKRQLIKKVEHKKSGFIENIDGIEIEKGYKSQIIAVSCGDNPDAIRGKDATRILMEEAGKWPNLKASYNSTRPTVEDGDFVTGQIFVYGTGGPDNDDWADFADMFYNPDLFNFRAYDNTYDEDGYGMRIGYFVPNYKSKPGFIDDNGNSLIAEAKASDEAEREKTRRTAKSPKDLDDYIIEYPHTPHEATTISSANMFPTADIHAWRRQLVSREEYKHIGTPGYFEETKEGIKWRPGGRNIPVDEFPVKPKSDRTGCVVMYYPPYKTDKGIIPDDMYIIAHDPVGSDSTNGESLGAAYVLCRPNRYTKPDDCIVASYIGRPDFQDDYNKILFQLAEYYNARIGFENDRGEVIPYAKRFHKLHYLEEEFDMLSKRDSGKKLGRMYGMSMSTDEKKAQGEIYVRDWIKAKRGEDGEGRITLNLHKIFDIALLDEMLRYNRGNHDNFDRISSLMIGMYYMKELYAQEVEYTAPTENDFFDRNLF